MNNTNHGFMIGRFYVPDEITVRASWMLPALTVPLAMVIHLLNGNSRDFPIFISEADYPGVERWVFTIGLALSGIIQMVFAYRMWLQTKDVGRRKLVHFSLLCGLVTGGNLLVMSFADMYDHIALHVLTASLVFQVGIVWGITAHFAVPYASQRSKNIRIFSVLLSIASYVVMSQAVVRAVSDLEAYGLEDDTIFTLDRIQYAIDVAAYAEYALFASLILCLYSFEQIFNISDPSDE